MKKPYDSATKQLLESRPGPGVEFLGLHADGPVSVVNAELASVHAEADVVIRIDGPDPWLLHVESQTSNDPSLPDRLLRYNVLLRHRHGVPVRSVAILLRESADGPELTGVHRREYPDGGPYFQFHYRVERIWRQPVAAFLEGDIGLVPLAPLAADAEADLPGVVRLLVERIERETPLSEVGTLLAAAYILMGLRYPEEQNARLFQGVTKMKDSVTYQAILEEGEAKGLAKGKAEGIFEGRIEEGRRLILRQGLSRFGLIDPRATAALHAIHDLETLERLAERLLHVSSWDELLAKP